MGKGINLAEVSNEVYLRIDQGNDPNQPKLTKHGCYEMSKAMFDVVGKALEVGEEVAIPQFGKFVPVAKPARNARNPKTGETIKVPAKTVIKFRPGSALRTKVAGAKVVSAPKKTVPKKKIVPKKKKK